MSEAHVLEKYAVDYPEGSVLFREGDAGDVMFVVQRGRVEISRQIGRDNQVLAVLPPGEFFGEMAILNQRPRSATAVVVEDARLLVIDGRTFEAMLRGKTEIAVRMIKTMAGRLDRANQQIELLLLQDKNHRVVQCLRQLAEEHGADAPGAVYLPVDNEALAARVALSTGELAEVLARLTSARLILEASAAGIEQPGYVVPEVGRLMEFIEFLEMRDRFGGA